MGYPTKVQSINRKQSEQWYINFPAAVAQAMESERGETVESISVVVKGNGGEFKPLHRQQAGRDETGFIR